MCRAAMWLGEAQNVYFRLSASEVEVLGIVKYRDVLTFRCNSSFLLACSGSSQRAVDGAGAISDVVYYLYVGVI